MNDRCPLLVKTVAFLKSQFCFTIIKSLLRKKVRKPAGKNGIWIIQICLNYGKISPTTVRADGNHQNSEKGQINYSRVFTMAFVFALPYDLCINNIVHANEVLWISNLILSSIPSQQGYLVIWVTFQKYLWQICWLIQVLYIFLTANSYKPLHSCHKNWRNDFWKPETDDTNGSIR